jgi:hypothetical protein
MTEKHVCRYDDKVVDQVRTLDGYSEDVVSWRCACGAVKPLEPRAPGPRPGEWI